jgi:hypothetical protein
MRGLIILRGSYAADTEFSQVGSIMEANARQIYLYTEPDIGIRVLALGVPDLTLESW